MTLRPLRKLPLFIFLIWAWELSVMLIIDSLPQMPVLLEAFVDATTLILVTAYPAWIWVVKPLLGHAERKADLFERVITEFAMIGITDSQGVITSVNDKFCEISKFSKEELIGKNHRIMKSGIHDKAFYKEMWDTIKANKVWRGQICNRAKDGSLFWLETAIFPILDESNKIEGYYSLKNDITQLKVLTEKERQQSLRMVQSVKMASLGEMAAGIAHEINNPLAVITGKTQLLQRMMSNNQIEQEKVDLHLNAINRTADRISEIVKGLRNFSREEKFDAPMKEIALKEIIEDTLNLCQSRFLSKGVKLITPEIDNSIRIECHPSQISQAILNLLNNSFEAVQSLDEKWIVVSARDAGSDVEISIMDSGLGISQEIRKKIMEPFFTTKPVGQGAGLGLSVAMGIAKSHKGSLVVDAESKNTTFILRLPKRQST